MNKLFLSAGVFALLLGTIGVTTNTAFAYKGDPSVKGPNYSVERHKAIEKAFENKDYASWKQLMKDKGRVAQLITKENFDAFIKSHELAEQGKFEEAQKIRQELGLPMQNGRGQKQGKSTMKRTCNH